MKQGSLYTTAYTLIFLGFAVCFYKFKSLGFPLLPKEKVQEIVIEAKISFLANERPVRVDLTLPKHLRNDLLANEAASVGYGFSQDLNKKRWIASWSAPNKEGPQTLYYRIRVPKEQLEQYRFSSFSKTEPKFSNKISYTGITLASATALVKRAQSLSSDHETLAAQLLIELNSESLNQEVSILKDHHLDKNAQNWKLAALIDLLEMAKIPAQKCYGVSYAHEQEPSPPLELVEYYDRLEWKVINPASKERSLDENIMIWNRGGNSLFDVNGGENSTITFATTNVETPADARLDLTKDPLLISTISSLPLSERNLFRYVVLIPVGVFIVVIFRNLIGISTLGTFMPVLLSLAFLEIPFIGAIIMFSVITAFGLSFRFFLSKMNLLVVPRVAACVIVVTLLMIFLSVLSYKLGYSTGLRITLFPMIVLAWTIERMSLLWEEEGSKIALQQVAGSLIVATAAFAVMRLEIVRYWVFYFPEILISILGATLLLGRYMGYRLTELFRFNQPKTISPCPRYSA